MKKYYTPKIEEFYVGFEFETLNNKKWNRSRLVSGRQLDQGVEIGEYDERVNVRVEYLSKEDIESLGFGHTVDLYEDRTKLIFKNKEDTILLYTFYKDMECPVVYLYNYIGKDINTIFNLKVKNKSELEKLLSQANVETN